MLELSDKREDNTIRNTRYSLFPFAAVDKGSKIVIYGAGRYGKEYLKQVTKSGFCEIIALVDKDYKNMDGVSSPSSVLESSFDYVVIAISNPKISNEIKQDLILSGIPKDKIVDGCCDRVIK